MSLDCFYVETTLPPFHVNDEMILGAPLALRAAALAFLHREYDKRYKRYVFDPLTHESVLAGVECQVAGYRIELGMWGSRDRIPDEEEL